MPQIINIKRYIASLELEPNDYLLPLHEVVVNAIQSIEDSRNKENGLIKISVVRDGQLTLGDKEDEAPYKPIVGFEIEDNGVGFIQKRFKAFHEWGTEINIHKGGKGVGRYTVLGCFGSMEIKSEFKENDKYYKREFRFDAINDIQPDGEKNKSEISKTKNKTVVKLNNYMQKFSETIIKKRVEINDIAENVIQHCLLYFVEKNAPTIVLKNKDEENKLILNDIFKTIVKYDYEPVSMKIGNIKDDFTLHYIRNYQNKSHWIHLCANKREVGKRINASSHIPAFVKGLEDENEKKYYLSIYTTGKYLDEKANNQRTKFLIPKNEEDKTSFDDLSFEELYSNLSTNIHDKYEKIISETETEKNKSIRQYILNKKKPRLVYRHLLSMEKIFEDIPYNASEEKLEMELHRKTYELEVQRKNEFDRLFEKKKYDKDEFHEVINNLLKEEASFSYGKLADLLIHRKSIINLLKKYLEWRNDENYWLEQDLHNLIFTMGAETDTMPYDYHNLWLLDERLAFYRYTTSDKQLRTNKHINVESQKETDMLIYDFPWAYSDNPKKVNSLVIFEFKRPGRDMMSSKDDKKLDKQVEGYFEELMETKAKNDKGEFLQIEDNTPKYGYVICSLHKDLIEWNVKHNYFKKTPFETLYKINPELNLYIEVMDYNNMIDFAEKRHVAFFKALGIENIE